MKNKIFLLIITLFVGFAACKKDDSVPNQDPTGGDPMEDPKEDPKEEDPPAEDTVTLTSSVVVDETGKLILYNGGTVALKKNVKIGDVTYSQETSDADFEVGKAYTFTSGSQTYTFYRTELPVVTINTNGGTIATVPKIASDFVLHENGTDAYESTIGIEFLEGSPLDYPKASFEFELWTDSSGGAKDVSLLGMESNDDWILNAMYNDQIKLRDYVAHDLWGDMARYPYATQEPDLVFGIERKFVEVFLDGEYQGVYWLGEKLDYEKLALTAYDSELRGELYSGNSWEPGTLFSGLEAFDNASPLWSGYEAEYPGAIGQIDWANLHGFVDYVVNSGQAVFDAEVNDQMAVDNLIDYFLLINVIFAQDNIGRNLLIGKYDKDEPYFLTAWDMDGSFGNDFNGDRAETADFPLFNGLYRKLQKNDAFIAALKARWADLRTGLLSDTSLEDRFAEAHTYLSENGVYEREALFPSLTKVAYGSEELDFIVAWIKDRNAYLDTWVPISETLE